MLRDTTGFTGGDVRGANAIHEGGLAVIDVTEEGHNWGARYKLIGAIFRDVVILVRVLNDRAVFNGALRLLLFDGEAVEGGDLRSRVGFDALVDGRSIIP